ncbi:MAG: DNA mismatch repair endonuclease MutL [Haloferacaceae archaeon]
MSEETEGGEIRALDQRTVQRIAAGEVVERPASVVKELVENSLDAGATRVSVAVERGGIDGIRVRDDGRGIGPDELAVAVEEHTTSKISDIDDLEAGVGTLGFRGEALSTIAAVSELTVRSRPPGETGAELTVSGGDVGEVSPAGCPPGTTVEVEELFFNTPARRKFLKTEATEFDHVSTVVTQYALANPDVAVSLDHDDREVFATEGNGDLRATVLSVYGREVAESMLDVDGDLTDADAPVESVTGLVSHPETTRAGREYLSTFVNDRYVTESTLRQAVLDAYGGQLAPDRYPFAVLFVDLPPDAVDVNVHPRKMEVRFDDEEGVTDAVASAVREALLDAGLLRSGAPRGRSRPDETEVRPERGRGTDPDERVGDTGASGDPTAASADDWSSDGDSDDRSPADDEDGRGPAGDADSDWPDDDADGDRPSPTESDDGRDWVVESQSTPERRWRVRDESEDEASSWPESASGGGDGGGDVADDGGGDVADGGGDRPADDAYGGTDVADDGVAGAGASVTGPTAQRTLTGETATPETSFDSLPDLRVLGQLHDTYVVAESPEGLVLVDQHAADERINYERLRGDFEGGGSAQALADPVALELTAREAALFDEYADALERLGFRAERTDERTVEVRAVPAVFDATLDPDLLRDALTAFVSDGQAGGAETVESVADALLADLACYPSITGNTSLHEGSVVDLLESLDACENPWACPHGRPVVVGFDREDIENRFERDYPGHAGRREE